MSQHRPPKTYGARIAAAVLDLALVVAFVAVGIVIAHPVAHWLSTPDAHTARSAALASSDAAILTVLIAYLVAGTFAGAGLLLKRLPQRVQIPLGSPIAWFVLVALGAIVGLVALPLVVLWRLAGVVLALIPRRAAAAPSAPASITVNVPPTRVYLVDRRGEVMHHLDDGDPGYVEVDGPSPRSIAR